MPKWDKLTLIILAALAMGGAGCTGTAEAAKPPVVETAAPLDFRGALKTAPITTPAAQKFINRQYRMLNQLSQVVVDKLVSHGVTWYLCHCPVVDMPEVRPFLYPAIPLGYKPGETWANVDGVYLPTVNVVAIGYAGNDGSKGLALHETAHAIVDVYRLDLNPDLERHYQRQVTGDPLFWNPYYDLPEGRGKNEWFADTFAAHLRQGKWWTEAFYDAAYSRWMQGLIVNLSDAEKERV